MCETRSALTGNDVTAWDIHKFLVGSFVLGYEDCKLDPAMQGI